MLKKKNTTRSSLKVHYTRTYAPPRSFLTRLSARSFLHADFAVAAILISFGAVLGVASPVQLLVMATLEVVAYNLSFYVTAGFKVTPKKIALKRLSNVLRTSILKKVVRI